MITAKQYISNLRSPMDKSNNKIIKSSFAKYIHSQLSADNGGCHIYAYDQPLLMCFSTYFALLSNHRFYKLSSPQRLSVVSNNNSVNTNVNNQPSGFMSLSTYFQNRSLDGNTPLRRQMSTDEEYANNNKYGEHTFVAPFSSDIVSYLPIPGCLYFLMDEYHGTLQLWF